MGVLPTPLFLEPSAVYTNGRTARVSRWLIARLCQSLRSKNGSRIWKAGGPRWNDLPHLSWGGLTVRNMRTLHQQQHGIRGLVGLGASGCSSYGSEYSLIVIIVRPGEPERHI